MCEVLDFLISFKFHECLETMLASTPASLGHHRSKCDFHLDPISLANAIQTEIFVFSISPPCTDFTHFTELSQGEIALRDGLACAVIQVHHFASGAQQGSLRSRSQVKPQSIRRLVLSLRICHCKILHSRRVRFDSCKRRRKVDEHKILVCHHCHRHHHQHRQTQDVIRLVHTPQGCLGSRPHSFK